MSSPQAQIKVVFEGQTEPTVLKIKPVGLMAVERKFGGKAFEENPIEAMMYGVWVGLGKAAGDFDMWVATIDEIVQDDDPPVPATPSEPSPPSL